MTLEQATQLIGTCAEQMNARYRKTVFNEWAVVSMADNRGRLLAYNGPRKEDFRKNFLADAGALRPLMQTEQQAGDFEFARDGVGTGFELIMALGKGMYLICNNTVQSMDGIAKDPLWLGAQVPFADLSDRFRTDPLTA